jgi:hypothetical protein
MKHYALLFHTNSNHPLTPKEQERRQVEIAAWAKQVTDMGIKLDPRALGETAANLSVEGGKIVFHNGSSDPAFRNLGYIRVCTTDPPSRYANGPTLGRPRPNTNPIVDLKQVVDDAYHEQGPYPMDGYIRFCHSGSS